MSTLPAFATPYLATPYITTSEYRNAPTAVDTSHLVDGGDQRAQTVELGNVILRASSLIDQYCRQQLTATVNIETGRLRPNRNGELHVKTRQFPVLEVEQFLYGSMPSNLVPLASLANLWIEPKGFQIVGLGPVNVTSSGPLQLGSPFTYGSRLFCSWQYAAGWPNTLLANGTYTAGASAITVVSPVGCYGTPATMTAPQATQLMIYDGENTEAVTVASVAGPVLTLATPLAATHAASSTNPVSVSALPPVVKQAAILLTSALIKTKGDSAMVLMSMEGRTKQLSTPGGEWGASTEDIGLAADMLTDFRVI